MIEILGISFGAAGLLTLFLLGPAPFRRLVRVEAFAVVRRRAGRNDWTTPDRR
jgi:predicted lysophospholipase L1 biosynthesis ABC-type transport system permease subunit